MTNPLKALQDEGQSVWLQFVLLQFVEHPYRRQYPILFGGRSAVLRPYRKAPGCGKSVSANTSKRGGESS